MKVKIIAQLDIEKDILEIEDGMTEDEIENYLLEYILDFLDWNWKEVEEWEYLIYRMKNLKICRWV